MSPFEDDSNDLLLLLLLAVGVLILIISAWVANLRIFAKTFRGKPVGHTAFWLVTGSNILLSLYGIVLLLSEHDLSEHLFALPIAAAPLIISVLSIWKRSQHSAEI